MKKSFSNSEELFKKAFITSPDSININRLSDGMYVSVNAGFTKITGYSEEDTIGKTSLELNIWANPADRDNLIKGLRESGQVENLETRFKMKNGTIRDGIMSATIIELDGIPNILSITRDITEMKYAEMAIRESESRYRELIELAVDGILLGSSDGIIISANTYMINLTGRTLDQLLGLNISSLFPTDVLDQSPLKYDLLKKGETVINERYIVRPDGKLVNIEMHTKMMPDGSYQSIFHDITRRKEAEKALRESEEWFRILFEQSTDGILYLNLDGEIISANKSFAEMHGYSPEEILNMHIGIFGTPGTKAFHKERINRLDRGENLKFEVEHFHKDGHIIPLEVTAVMVVLGHRKFIMASHRDISERIRAEETIRIARDKAEASDRLKTSFLNNISHEVRTPLNGILGFAELILRDDLTSVEKKEALAMVFDSSNRLLDTITNYMDRSLLVSGQMTLSSKDFSPALLLNDLYRKFEPLSSSKNLILELDLPTHSDNNQMNSDPEIIEKIFSHLLNNAIKFTEEGTIRFGYNNKDSFVEFYVIDTGIGIGKESIGMIFEHFAKEEIKARPSEGSGLGLSISKDLAELLDGKLSVETEKGKGSKFYFTIPVKSGSSLKSDGAELISASRFRSLSGILIAEDDLTNFLYIKALLLKNSSTRIIHAVNGREAIEKFSSNPGIDLVLMDIKMPEVDGYEATRFIKSINPFVPVIAITAYAMIGDEKKILDSGFDGYLSKPLNRVSLMKKIEEVINA